MDMITLKDFRCFHNEQTARLAPLTLLVGENSTGKTSFLALIRALWEVAYLRRIPDFKEEPYDLGSFDEIAHHRGARGSRAETFEGGFDITLEEGRSELTNRYRFEITFGKRGTIPIPVRRRLSDINKSGWVEYGDPQADPSSQIHFGTARGEWALAMQERIEFRLDEDDRTLPFYSLYNVDRYLGRGGRRLSPELTTLTGGSRPNANDWKLIEQISRIGRSLLYNPKWAYASAPVRSKPHRTYDPSRPTRDPEGDYVPMYLANIHFQDKRKWEILKGALEEFGKEAGLFNEISVKPLGQKESGPFQIQVRGFGRAKKKGPQRNLIDVGYGVSQVLPVITELLRRDAPPMFLLQQPEVHLHPSAQAAMGSLFCQVAGPERQLVVETHSDHLIDRVRMDVRDGKTKLKPEDISILYFERNNLDVHIHSLRFDEDGNVLDAPDGYRQFFLEETRRSLGL